MYSRTKRAGRAVMVSKVIPHGVPIGIKVELGWGWGGGNCTELRVWVEWRWFRETQGWLGVGRGAAFDRI